jgi:hypothetical protein
VLRDVDVLGLEALEARRVAAAGREEVREDVERVRGRAAPLPRARGRRGRPRRRGQRRGVDDGAVDAHGDAPRAALGPGAPLEEVGRRRRPERDVGGDRGRERADLVDAELLLGRAVLVLDVVVRVARLRLRRVPGRDLRGEPLLAALPLGLDEVADLGLEGRLRLGLGGGGLGGFGLRE